MFIIYMTEAYLNQNLRLKFEIMTSKLIPVQISGKSNTNKIDEHFLLNDIIIGTMKLLPFFLIGFYVISFGANVGMCKFKETGVAWGSRKHPLPPPLPPYYTSRKKPDMNMVKSSSVSHLC